MFVTERLTAESERNVRFAPSLNSPKEAQMNFQKKSIRILSMAPAAALFLMATIVHAEPAPSTTPPSTMPQPHTAPESTGPTSSPQDLDPTGSMSSSNDMDTTGVTKPGISKPDSGSSTAMPRDAHSFDALDSNHDGFLSRLEGEHGGMSDYSDVDRNGDGQLDQEEFGAGNASPRTVTPAEPLSDTDSSNSESSSTNRTTP